jgi:CHAT domain-containing protein
LFDLLQQPAKADTKEKLDQTARQLARMILWPAGAELSRKRILVAADDALHYIPFQVLPVGETNAEPLLAQHEIVNVPSASILGELRKEAARRGVHAKILAAFGNPVFAPISAEEKEKVQVSQAQITESDPIKRVLRNIESQPDDAGSSDDGQLFYSGREIANLREVASDEQTLAATEYDATRERLLKTDLTQYAILHIATHGRFDPEHPEKSGLKLSTVDRDGKTVEGFVGLQDVYSLRAPVDLVVLSACQTGLGKDVRGEGLLGLTRGFMYAGGTSVVASLWKVEDEVTAELMKRFYTEMLRNQKTPAEALRAAQNSIRQTPEWSAPHYWAGFTLQGEYRYVVNSSRGWQWRSVVFVSGLVLIGLAGAFLLYRRRSASPVAH